MISALSKISPQHPFDRVIYGSTACALIIAGIALAFFVCLRVKRELLRAIPNVRERREPPGEVIPRERRNLPPREQPVFLRAEALFAQHPHREVLLDRIYNLLLVPPPFRELGVPNPAGGDPTIMALQAFFWEPPPPPDEQRILQQAEERFRDHPLKELILGRIRNYLINRIPFHREVRYENPVDQRMADEINEALNLFFRRADLRGIGEVIWGE